MKNTYTIVWSWYGNTSMLAHETFADKRACWTRVQAIMAMRHDHHEGKGAVPVCRLQVYTQNGNGQTSVTFRVYGEESPYSRWGVWGAESPFVSSSVRCG